MEEFTLGDRFEIHFFLTVNFAIHKSLPFSGLYVEIKDLAIPT